MRARKATCSNARVQGGVRQVCVSPHIPRRANRAVGQKAMLLARGVMRCIKIAGSPSRLALQAARNGVVSVAPPLRRLRTSSTCFAAVQVTRPAAPLPCMGTCMGTSRADCPPHRRASRLLIREMGHPRLLSPRAGQPRASSTHSPLEVRTIHLRWGAGQACQRSPLHGGRKMRAFTSSEQRAGGFGAWWLRCLTRLRCFSGDARGAFYLPGGDAVLEICSPVGLRVCPTPHTPHLTVRPPPSPNHTPSCEATPHTFRHA